MPKRCYHWRLSLHTLTKSDGLSMLVIDLWQQYAGCPMTPVICFTTASRVSWSSECQSWVRHPPTCDNISLLQANRISKRLFSDPVFFELEGNPVVDIVTDVLFIAQHLGHRGGQGAQVKPWRCCFYCGGLKNAPSKVSKFAPWRYDCYETPGWPGRLAADEGL